MSPADSAAASTAALLRDPRAPFASAALDHVLIVMLAAVGDAVHALPVITAIKRFNPRARISWVMQTGALTQLLTGHPSIDAVIPFARKDGWRGFADVRRRLRQDRYDAVLILQPYLKSGVVASFAPSPLRLGFDRARARDASWLFSSARIPARPLQHMQDQYLEFLAALGLPSQPLEWKIGPWNDAEREWQRQFFARFDRPVAPIVVATSKAAKDWPAERWAEVCDALWSDFGLQPLLVGGRSPREVEAERVIFEKAHVKPASALGDGGLRGLAAIIEKSALVLSPDTGPLHLSVALGTPVISLLGYTNPKRVGPYRKFSELMIDAYAEPGEDYAVSMENRPGRMERISVSQVLEKVAIWKREYAKA